MKNAKIVLIFIALIAVGFKSLNASGLGGKITDGLNELGKKVIEKNVLDAYKKSQLHKACEDATMLSMNVSVDNALRLFLKKYGITTFPLESLQRLKRSLAVCGCDHPKESAALLEFNPAPLIEVCFTPLLNAIMKEIGACGLWLWYYMKILGHKIVGK